MKAKSTKNISGVWRAPTSTQIVVIAQDVKEFDKAIIKYF